jgi:hypothetical protein
MPADLIIRIPTTMPRYGSWIETLEDELIMRGILANIEERTGLSTIGRNLIYDVLRWRCMEGGESTCPAVVFEGEKARLLKIDGNEEKYVKVYDLEEVLVEEIIGMIKYSECVARYGYDYC